MRVINIYCNARAYRACKEREMKRIICIVFSIALLLGFGTACNGCEKEKSISSRYEICVEYVPENGTLTGTEKLTFENTTESELSVLKFQLYPNAYRKEALYKPVAMGVQGEAYYAGESYGEMVISSVNGAKNWEIAGEDENILYAYLERSLFPGDKVVLDIGFTVRFAKVNHRTGITEKTVNLGNFFPILCGFKNGGFYEVAYYNEGDPFYNECADYKVTIRTPKEYAVASSGGLVLERTLESKTERVFALNSARDFAIVLSKEFSLLQTDVNGKTLTYYYYDDAFAQKNLDTAKEAFAYFEKTFGEYPYEQYSVAGCNTKECYKSNDCRDAHHCRCKICCKNAAYQCQRQVKQYHSRQRCALELAIEQHEYYKYGYGCCEPQCA